MENGEASRMIPVYVNVFNRLTTTRKLCEQLAAMPCVEVIIVDNDSTWEPLLDWYAECPYEVIRLRENLGHHAPWLSGAVEHDPSPFYCVTDCDLDLENIPSDLMSVLQRPLMWHETNIVKSGVSLRINDLPEWQSSVKNWESRFWKRSIGHGYYVAPVDTTLAMYRRDTLHATAMQVVRVFAVRSAEPYTARHVPWYLDAENLDDENKNYFATANASNSWKPSGKALAAPYTGEPRRASRR